MTMLAPCTCLITGGAGFIGSHLAERLLADGHRVLVMDDLSTGRLENIAAFSDHPRLRFVRGSVEEPGALDSLASESRVIFHLAAAAGVKLVMEKPLHTLRTNIRGTERVLEAAMRHRCRVVVTSSSEVYGKGVRTPFGEEDDVLLGPTSKRRWAFAASKMVDEFMTLACVAEQGAALVCARLFNTVGPRQSGDYGMVIPRLVRQALRAEPITVYGDGRQTRCFCDVRDALEALIGLAASDQASGQVFNVGSCEEVAILDLARRIQALTGSRSGIRHIPYAEAYGPGFEDMQRRVPDLARIEKLLGWKPTRRLDEILGAVIEHERRSLARPADAALPEASCP